MHGIRPISKDRIEFYNASGELQHVAHSMAAAEAIIKGRGLTMQEVAASMKPGTPDAPALGVQAFPASEAVDVAVLSEKHKRK